MELRPAGGASPSMRASCHAPPFTGSTLSLFLGFPAVSLSLYVYMCLTMPVRACACAGRGLLFLWMSVFSLCLLLSFEKQ